MKAKGGIEMWHENSHKTVILTVFMGAYFICRCHFHSYGKIIELNSNKIEFFKGFWIWIFRIFLEQELWAYRKNMMGILCIHDRFYIHNENISKKCLQKVLNCRMSFHWTWWNCQQKISSELRIKDEKNLEKIWKHI